MPLFEMRTYTLYVGKMEEAEALYTELGYPALQRGGHDKKLIGYFQSDTGIANQIMHFWRFEDDADRRKHWKGVRSNEDFISFVMKFRPMIMNQEIRLFNGAPWGPQV